MDIVKILSHYRYDVYGDSGKIVCPFHPDKEASLSVDFKRGALYCFGCGWKGDIIEFVAKIEGVNRLDALMKISNYSLGAVATKPLLLKPPRKEWIKNAWLEYKNAFTIDWNAQHPLTEYMRNRGIKPTTLKKLGVRVVPVNDYPFIIPIKDNGKFCGYVKRALEDSHLKYLYNRGFRRQYTLMGQYRKGIVFVTEGVFDYMKAYQFGENNVACLFGWKASRQQIDKLQSVTDTIIAGLDNDDRGKEGVEYLKRHFKVIEFPYPDGVKDIGEMSLKMFKQMRRQCCEKA